MAERGRSAGRAGRARRVERIGDCALYLWDCLDVLPTLGDVDAVVTDPPYGTSFVGGYNRAGELILNDDDISVMDRVFRECGVYFRDFWITTFHSQRNIHDFCKATEWMTYRGGAVWDKRAPGLGYGLIRYQHECISFFTVGKPLELHPISSSVLSHFRAPRDHPNQKPVELMQSILGYFPEDGVVLDPFMGSGTTGVACARLGRKFIGIEIEERYFDVACRRVEEEYRRGDFLRPEPGSSSKATSDFLRGGG